MYGIEHQISFINSDLLAPGRSIRGASVGQYPCSKRVSAPTSVRLTSECLSSRPAPSRTSPAPPDRTRGTARAPPSSHAYPHVQHLDVLLKHSDATLKRTKRR